MNRERKGFVSPEGDLFLFSWHAGTHEWLAKQIAEGYGIKPPRYDPDLPDYWQSVGSQGLWELGWVVLCRSRLLSLGKPLTQAQIDTLWDLRVHLSEQGGWEDLIASIDKTIVREP
jgi:hypothetical protein